MARSLKLRQGDTVLITTGKDRGKKGVVRTVDPARGRLILEGLNVVKKHLKPTPKHPHGGVVEMSAPLHASNVVLVCGACGHPTRVKAKVTAQGSIRICQHCQAAVATTSRATARKKAE